MIRDAGSAGGSRRAGVRYIFLPSPPLPLVVLPYSPSYKARFNCHPSILIWQSFGTGAITDFIASRPRYLDRALILVRRLIKPICSPTAERKKWDGISLHARTGRRATVVRKEKENLCRECTECTYISSARFVSSACAAPRNTASASENYLIFFGDRGPWPCLKLPAGHRGTLESNQEPKDFQTC